MKKLIPILFCLLLSACNLPTSDETDLNDQAATIVAMTLVAESTPTVANTPLPSPTLAMTGTVTPTITPTYSVPMLKLLEPTNCRMGPGQSFDILFTFLAGASAEIIGVSPVNNYWVVKVEGMDDPCWVWGEYAEITGSSWAVPTIMPPPTETARPLSKPGNMKFTYSCSYNGVNSDVSVTLTWTDQSDDELSYRVFRDNALVAELPPNSKTFSETTAADSTQTLTYSVSAYGPAGESGRATISFSCQ